MGRLKTVRAALSVATALAAACGAAEAQEIVLEEIVVTAQKRAQRLIDVPASIAAVDAAKIDDLSIKQLSELSNHVPNLVIDSSTSLNSAVYIRGVGANSRNIGFDTRVGVYLDGVYLGQSPALNQELLDLERVEVLRGPQGTLFGKNTVAGAINMVSKQPGFEREGFVSLRAGNYDDRQGAVRLNMPLSDTVAVRLSASKAERDGYTRNLFDGSTVGNRDVFSWRGQLRWDATEALTVSLSADGLRARELGEYGNAISNSFGSALVPLYAQPRRINIDNANKDRRDVFGTALDLSYALAAGGIVKSISSYRSTEFFSSNDVDYSTADLMTVEFGDEYDQYTQEFQWVSPSGERFEHVVGLYLYQQDADTSRTARAGSLGPALGLAPGASMPTSGDVRTRNAALYANAEYDLTEKLSLGAGFRWSWEEKKVDYSIDSRQMPMLGLATGRFADDRTDKDFSPTITLNYAFSPRLNGFLRYAGGYKSGGYNLDFVGAAAFPNGLEFTKEEASSYEAGIKGDLLDRRLNFSITGFRTDFDDYQVDQFQNMGNTVAIVIGNASKVRTKGMEMEADWRLTQGFSLNAGLGFMDTVFTSFPGGGALGSDASGRRVPGAAKFQASLGADYRLAIGENHELALHADYTHRGSYYSDIDNLSTLTIGGVTVPFDQIKASDFVNARIALSSPDAGWNVAVWSRNLFDKRHVSIYGGDFFGTRTRRYAPPRTWGLEASVRF